jgi:hypothetical protein
MSKRAKLFEYAVLYHPTPTKEQKDNGTEPDSKLILGVATMLAVNEQEVGMQIARELDEEYMSKISQIDIIIRPF